jgi:diaminopimelate decarboxylase
VERQAGTGAEQTAARPWWQRPGLDARDGRLRIAGRDAESLAREHGTPLIVYDLVLVQDNLRALHAAFERARLPHLVRIALKAQRSPELLAVVRAVGAPGSEHAVGIDACSPAEVEHALAHGFLPAEISVTGTNFTDRDLATILAHPVHVNADLVTQLDRIGRLSPGRPVGLRLNPMAGAVNARSDAAYYSGARPTKFGVYAQDLERAVEVARRHRLVIDTAHFHVSNGLLDEDLPAFEHAVTAIAAMVETLLELGCPITEINAGGGLGVAFHPWERPLDLDAYVGVLARRLGGFGATLSCEPGEWVTCLSGTLLTEVATVEDRLGYRFAGLNVGWNVVNHRVVYKVSLPFVHTTAADAPSTQQLTFTGNINEGADLFVEDWPFPEVREGDIVAMLGVGCYTLTNYHPHCLRPPATVLFFADRIEAAG